MTIQVIISNNQNPFYNLAFEKWAIEHLDCTENDYLLLYVNEPAVVVGRNQNIYQEVNVPYCIANEIKICRRISGGGTVFHDMGNLNWCLITQNNLKKVNSYDWAVQPLFNLLETYQVKPYLTQRNAIEIDGLKISGQAQFTSKKNLLSHGTLLVNSLQQEMQKAIEPVKSIHIQSKASPSVRSKTANLSTLLGKEMDVATVIKDLIEVNNLEKVAFDFAKHDEHFDSDLLQSKQWLDERCPKFVAMHNSIDYTVEKGLITQIKKGSQQVESLFLNKNYTSLLFSISGSVMLH